MLILTIVMLKNYNLPGNRRISGQKEPWIGFYDQIQMCQTRKCT